MLKQLIKRTPPAEPTSRVLYQYLTVGFAHVVVTARNSGFGATCTGCDAFPKCSSWSDEIGRIVDRLNVDSMKRWAQRHAEFCRAIPR
jgi:hypothetical protein